MEHPLKNTLKPKIILIVLLSLISINSVFADVEYAESLYGTFEIDGMVVEGTLFAQKIEPGNGYLRVTPPWAFIGYYNGNPIIIVSDSPGNITIVFPPLINSKPMDEDYSGSLLNSSIEKEFNITYNPTNEILEISSVSNPIDVVVYDLSGKIVYTNSGPNLTISTNSLSQAESTYILKATLDGQTITKKFIISNGNCFFSPAKAIIKNNVETINTNNLLEINGTYIIKNLLSDDQSVVKNK